MVDSVDGARSVHRRLPPQIRDRCIPAGARRPVCLDLREEDHRQGPALVRKEHHGLGPVQICRLPDRPVDQRRAQPRLFPQGDALPRRLHRHLRPQAGGRDRGDPQRSRRHRIPRFSALGGRRVEEGARRQAGDPDQRLELRRAGDPEPRAQAVRRRAGAPRLDPGDRPLGQRARAVQDRPRAHGRRRHLPGVAAWPRARRNCSRSPATGPISRNRAPRRGVC